MEAHNLFERAMAWLQENYAARPFFAERDVVWTVQLRVRELIAEARLPYRVFNDHRMPNGGLADLVVLDDYGGVEVAVEFKYEPSHARSTTLSPAGDIVPGKFPVVTWQAIMEDIKVVRRYVRSQHARRACALLIDEGSHFASRRAPTGSEWGRLGAWSRSVMDSGVKPHGRLA